MPKRKALLGSGLLVLTLAVLPVPGANAGLAGSPSVYGPTTTVRPDQPLPPGATSTVSIAAARNEFASFQVAVKADAAGVSSLRIDPGTSTLQRSGGGGAISFSGPGSDSTFYREASYAVTGFPGISDAEGGLGLWPDALIPEIDPIYGEDRNAFPVVVPADGVATAWVDVFVPAGQPAGLYTGTVAVTDGATTLATVTVNLTVRGFSVPVTSSLPSLFLTDYKSECQAHTGNAFCGGDEDTRWRLHALYARVALEDRVTIANPFPLGYDQAPTTADQLAKFNTYIQPLIAGTGDGAGPFPRRLSGAKMTSVTALWQCIAANGCLAAWKSLANANGFADRFIVYACDEPSDTGESCSWNEAPGRLDASKAIWPEAPRLVTTPIQEATSHGVSSKTDVITPLINDMDGWNCCNSRHPGNQRAAYDGFLDPATDTPGSASNRLWLYTSNASFGADWNETSQLWRGWPGYAIDEPAAQSRALGWMAFDYSASGELYYLATRELSTAWDANGMDTFGGHGDGTLFYPGTPARIGGVHDIPVESIRLKRMRDGRQDYEYLRMAAAQAPGQTQQIVDDVFGPKRTVAEQQQAGTDVSAAHNVNATIGDSDFDQARGLLAGLIENIPPPVDACNGVAATVAGATSGSDTLTGSDDPDVFNGLGGDDALGGLGGDDLICGSGGYDSLRGGNGDDYLDGGQGGGTAEFPLSPGAITADLATGTVTGEGSDTVVDIQDVTGSGFADTIQGDSRFNYLAGLGGDDAMSGAGGNDRLDGGTGNDNLNGGPGDDTLNGQDGVDISDYSSAPGPMTIDLSAASATGDGNDVLSGVEGVIGSGFGDQLRGSNGADSLIGGRGPDEITGGLGTDALSGGEGDDIIHARDGVADSVSCGPGNDDVEADGIDSLAADCEIDTPPPPPVSIAPNTAIQRLRVRGRTATLRFRASTAGATFACRLDRRPFRRCFSPKTYRRLSVGRHTFLVRAATPSGVDRTPARRTFRVRRSRHHRR